MPQFNPNPFNAIPFEQYRTGLPIQTYAYHWEQTETACLYQGIFDHPLYFSPNITDYYSPWVKNTVFQLYLLDIFILNPLVIWNARKRANLTPEFKTLFKEGEHDAVISIPEPHPVRGKEYTVQEGILFEPEQQVLAIHKLSIAMGYF
jgi:hypothetical protein